jgi:hypothetical protein
MESVLKDSLTRIEAPGQDSVAALATQGELLTLMLRQLTQIAELLAPRDDDDGMPLDELLARMIRQNEEQLRTARAILDVLRKLETELPRAVVAGLKDA